MDGMPSRPDDDHKQSNAMWWCGSVRRGEDSDDEGSGGRRPSLLRSASTSFQRIRGYRASTSGSNRVEEEAHNPGVWVLQKGRTNSVRTTREWFEEAVGSSRPKWKRLIGKLKNDIGEMRSMSFPSKQPRFQYDALSYSLNFDQGVSRPELESSDPAFSSRLAAPHPNPLETDGRALNEFSA